jgi:hypothetical protein
LLIAFFFGGCGEEAALDKAAEEVATENAPIDPALRRDFFTIDFLSRNNPNVTNSGSRSAASPDDIAALVAYVQALAVPDSILAHLTAKVGYPVWDKTQIEDGVHTTPFAFGDGKNTRAILVSVRQGDGYLLGLLREQSILSYLTKEGRKGKSVAVENLRHFDRFDKLLFNGSGRDKTELLDRFGGKVDGLPHWRHAVGYPVISDLVARGRANGHATTRYEEYYVDEAGNCVRHVTLDAYEYYVNAPMAACIEAGVVDSGGGGSSSNNTSTTSSSTSEDPSVFDDGCNCWTYDPYNPYNSSGGGTSTGSGTTSGGNHNFPSANTSYVMSQLGDSFDAFSGNQIDWMASHRLIFDSKILPFLNEKGWSAEAVGSVGVAIKLEENNWLEGPYPESQRDDIIAQYEFLDPIGDYQLFLMYAAQLVREHPNFPNLGKWDLFLVAMKAQWAVTSGQVHVLLDICGFVLDPCDPINGVLYLVEGDGTNAAFSFAASIPVIGIASTGTKYVKAFKSGGKIFNLEFKIGTNLYEFGSRDKLRQILKPATGEQAHHIITWASNSHKIVQLAAQASWHPSHIKNGINLNKSIHNGWDAAHVIYSDRLKNFLNSKIGTYTTPSSAKTFLENLQTSIRNQFNSGKKLDQITFP